MSSQGKFSLAELVRCATDRWPAWFHRPAPHRVQSVVVAGGPAHRSRLLVALFDTQAVAPAVFAKVALDERESGFVRQEADTLAAAYMRLPSEIAQRGPQPLGHEELATATVAYTRGLAGRRIADPNVQRRRRGTSWRTYDRFLDQALGWSARLAATGETADGRPALTGSVLQSWVRLFSSQHAGSQAERAAMESFADAVSTLGVVARPAWQHADLALSNSLLDGRDFRFLDWEHAGPGWEPWTDIASAPMALLAMGKRQEGGAFVDLVSSLLGDQHPGGAILCRRMRQRWTFPLPMAWGVVVTCMRRAQQRARDGRAAEAWAHLASVLLTDRRVRHAVPWLAPRW